MTEETKLNCSVNHNYREGYQQGRADTLTELWKMAISKYDEMLSLEELAECIGELEEKLE